MPELKGGKQRFPPRNSGAGEESRTLDLNLGKVALYQLSYSRRTEPNYSGKQNGVNAFQHSFAHPRIACASAPSSLSDLTDSMLYS